MAASDYQVVAGRDASEVSLEKRDVNSGRSRSRLPRSSLRSRRGARWIDRLS